MSQAEELEEMSLFDHLSELRKRIVSSGVVLFIMTFVCFGFAEQLFLWLKQPLDDIQGQQMIVLSPLEMLITYLKLAVLAAIFVSAPWVLLQVWLFIAPGLHALFPMNKACRVPSG